MPARLRLRYGLGYGYSLLEAGLQDGGPDRRAAAAVPDQLKHSERPHTRATLPETGSVCGGRPTHGTRARRTRRRTRRTRVAYTGERRATAARPPHVGGATTSETRDHTGVALQDQEPQQTRTVSHHGGQRSGPTGH